MGAEDLTSSLDQASHHTDQQSLRNLIYVHRGGGARRTMLDASGTTRLLLM